MQVISPHTRSPSLATVTSSRKSYRNRSSSPPARRKRRRQRSPSPSSNTTLGDLTGAVKSFAAALATSPSQTRLDPSPVRRTRAYQLAEDEEDLSDYELVAVMKLFSTNTEAADAYLAFKKKSVRTLWLGEMLKK